MRVTEPYIIFPRKLSSGKIVYYYQFRKKDGTRSSLRSTGCTSLSRAQRYCQKLYNDNIFDKEDIKKEKDEVITFKNFSKDFFVENGDFRKWKRANGYDLKDETVRRYCLSLDNHIVPFFANYDIKKISKDDCKKWIVWASEKWSPKSVNSAQGVLNLIFESAIDKELMTSNPLHHLGMRKIEKKKKTLLTIEELGILYNGHWANETERAVFLLTVITGMRIGEVCALQKQDINENCLDVNKTFSDKFGLQKTTKTGLCRFVPYPKGFNFPPSSTNFIFSSDKNEALKPHCVYNAFIRNLDNIGIKRRERGITLHSLRNFFVSYLRSKNISDPKIRAIVGHADETMTDLYTYWTLDMFPEVYEAQLSLYKQITEPKNEN